MTISNKTFGEKSKAKLIQVIKTIDSNINIISL